MRLSYLPPQEYPLQDLAGELAASLNDVRITNNTDVPPSLVSGNDLGRGGRRHADAHLQQGAR